MADDEPTPKRRGGRKRGSASAAGKPAEPFPIPPPLVEHILMGPAGDRRVLQDSPVLGDVWLAYAASPAGVHDILITPHKEATASEVAKRVSAALKRMDRGAERAKRAKIAYLQGFVAAKLSFDEVLRVLVPLTQWWHQRPIAKTLADYERDPAAIRARMGRFLSPERYRDARNRIAGAQIHLDDKQFSPLDRYIGLAGLILWVGAPFLRVDRDDADILPPIDIEEVFRRYGPNIDEIVNGLMMLDRQIRADAPAAANEAGKPQTKETDEQSEGASALIFQVSLNRRASAALDKSVPAVKADAARTLFKVNCDKIVWAVLDSGIYGEHDAFLVKDEAAGTEGENKEKKAKPRVRKTFDFTHIRDIIGDNEDIGDEQLEKLLTETGVKLDKNDARERLQAIAAAAREERPTNWGAIEGLITLEKPPRPTNPHGTHVAGIIGADQGGNGKTGQYAGGLCPDIRLYDFRVLGRSLDETEFAIIAALQYIRYVNERHSYITIHGANLSLSIPHNVRNFACGKTPVCNECERLVNSGVVVVAAAGNRGYQSFATEDGTFESYAAFSITDPGNSDGVITVGATHGNWPHTYGVSFFSSRGPTGDGRLKPDLVAPGERVQSTILDNEWGPESGTSMAAPHVSGAAAMLLARYPELIGQPRRVKRILCDNATDLGRERSFQGHGMLDVLRAFQSI